MYFEKAVFLFCPFSPIICNALISWIKFKPIKSHIYQVSFFSLSVDLFGGPSSVQKTCESGIHERRLKNCNTLEVSIALSHSTSQWTNRNEDILDG